MGRTLVRTVFVFKDALAGAILAMGDDGTTLSLPESLTDPEKSFGEVVQEAISKLGVDVPSPKFPMKAWYTKESETFLITVSLPGNLFLKLASAEGTLVLPRNYLLLTISPEHKKLLEKMGF